MIDLDTIKKEITPLVEERGFLVFGIKFSHYKDKDYLQIFVDKPEGGISLEECAVLNQEISEYLDKLDIFSQSYVLEVSSPGMDWPLKTFQDFRRVKNRKIRLILNTGKTLEAKLIEVGEKDIKIMVKEHTLTINIDEIKEAKEIIEL